MLCAVAAEDADRLVAHLNAAGETATVVGKLTERTGEPVTFTGALAL
jgi:phosphoribosylformylglycinamidine cyclo-ligase